MRYAALAFGVLAGLVASLILALGGLDPAMLPHFDPRQESVLRFGLFVVANLGVLGAGLALAAPIAGGVLFIVGAIAWVAAAVMLRHGADYVLITPPILLLIAFGFALAAFLRRRQHALADGYYDEEDAAASPIRAAMSDQQRDDDEPAEDEDPLEDETEPSGTPVRAGFFGQGGTAMPARVEAGVSSQPALRDHDDEPDDLSPVQEEDWRPGSRRPPPRQQPMFRQPDDDDDDDDDESRFSRFARGFSGVASFGLYAALAGAAVLVFVNWRNFDGGTPAAAKIDAKSSEVAMASPPPAAPVLPSLPSSAPSREVATTESSLPATNLITAAPTLGDSPLVAPTPATLANTAGSEPIQSPGGLVVAETPPPETSTQPALASASAEPAEALGPTVGTPANPMPFPLLPQMAAERARPAPKPAPPKPAAPKAAAPKTAVPPPPPAGDTGL